MTRSTGYKTLACRYCHKNEARVSIDCIALTCWECITNGLIPAAQVKEPSSTETTGTRAHPQTGKPVTVQISGQQVAVKSWIDSLKTVLNHLTTFNPEKFKTFQEVMPSYIGNDPKKFRRPLSLEKGYFCESNVSSGTIRSIVERARAYFSLEEQNLKIITS